MKRCYKCDNEKPLSEFSKKNTTKDRLQSSCKDCNRKYQRENYPKYKQGIIEKTIEI